MGVKPTHEHRCAAVGNRDTSPISATNTAALDRADAVDRLDGLIAAMALEVLVDVALEAGDLTVVARDQVPQ